ncbi:hypothetical protein BU14_0076s0043 [Porphyra umbilicalis]|uniref:Uncharacterized protein n=1 Tax=Porphyra umbilicalis TaxID=2786 RepID=A0A1X6PF59_PORUM|nr:hypothetical protein BU14_0076s0043 [Porphyra umbilicalis]|eukprot:OSX79487.1 hypothetical protein BU14_0076s0043 [Porphyra umbilicalis]
MGCQLLHPPRCSRGGRLVRNRRRRRLQPRGLGLPPPLLFCLRRRRHHLLPLCQQQLLSPHRRPLQPTMCV